MTLLHNAVCLNLNQSPAMWWKQLMEAVWMSQTFFFFYSFIVKYH